VLPGTARRAAIVQDCERQVGATQVVSDGERRLTATNDDDVASADKVVSHCAYCQAASRETGIS